MIIFNEGLPGSGKSFDAVANHILPAIGAGRHVYARLNGLKSDKIAEYLGVSVERVAELLHVVDPADVLTLPDVVLRDSLVIIDEVHEFWKAGKAALSPEQERFFAEHRHLGLDIVLMSQHYKRLHSAVRYRVERKILFKKLAVVGAPDRYEAVMFQAVAPDRYEKLGSRLGKYESAICDLYESVKPGTNNFDLYQQETASVWNSKALVLGVPAFALLLALGVWGFGGFFFSKPREASPKPQEAAQQRDRSMPRGSASASSTPSPDRAEPPSSPPLPPPPPKPPEAPNVQYVLDLLDASRPRLAAVAIAGGIDHCQIEFRYDGGGTVTERLTCSDLRSLGWSVGIDHGGRFAIVSHQQHEFIATSWPVLTSFGMSDDGPARSNGLTSGITAISH